MEDEMTDENPDYKERNVYKSSSREDLVENDEMSAGEAGFMQGYDEEEKEEDEELDEKEEKSKEEE